MPKVPRLRSLPLFATADDVYAALPGALPELVTVHPEGLSLFPSADVITPAVLEGRMGAWAVALLIVPRLELMGLRWSVSSGDERGRYCATVDRLHPRPWRGRTAVAFASTPGLALCAAACRALGEPFAAPRSGDLP